MTAPLALARELHERDPRLALLAMLPAEKRPAVHWGAFQRRGPSMDLLGRWLSKPGYSVGVIAGKPSDSLLVLDADSEDTFIEWRYRLGNPNTLIDKGLRGARMWFRTPVPVASTKRGKLDVIAQGHVIMAPGALHPSGCVYRILNDAPILALPS